MSELGEEDYAKEVLEQSTRQTSDDIFDDLEQGLNLDTEGYDDLLEYATETLEDYGSTDSAKDIVDLSKDLKQNVTDIIAYKELFQQKLGFLEDFDALITQEDREEAEQYIQENQHLKQTSVEADDIASIRALREGRLYDTIMSMGDEKDWDNSSIRNSELFDDINDVADAVITDYFFRGGKGLRSTMGQIMQYGMEETVDYETVVMGGMVETFHTSTLVQDDMMDGDVKRRDRASANVMMKHLFGDQGQDIPITTGNVMESWVNEMNIHQELNIPEESRQAMVRVQDIVNRGQNQDILMGRDITELDIDDYKDMSMGKTGFLYGAMLKMSAENAINNESYSEEVREEVNDLLGDYTFHFNLAFQASDDLLEVVGSDMDKSDSDISNRKKTATAITTDMMLRKHEDLPQVQGMSAEEYFRFIFSTDSENDPTENIVAAEGSSSIEPEEVEDENENIFSIQVSERAIDADIRRIMGAFEDVHREQLQRWADEATEATEELREVGEAGEGLNQVGANLLGKTAEAMNERTK